MSRADVYMWRRALDRLITDGDDLLAVGPHVKCAATIDDRDCPAHGPDCLSVWCDLRPDSRDPIDCVLHPADGHTRHRTVSGRAWERVERRLR